MGVVARSEKESGDLLVSGNIDTCGAPYKNGLVEHRSFDGNITREQLPLANAIPPTTKVLGCYQSNATHALYDWFNANTTLTDVVDITTVDVTTAMQYDLVIYDEAVWVADNIALLKSFVDAGVSVIAAGNDTTTNMFVSDYSGSTQVAYNFVLDYDSPVYKEDITTFTGGSSDLIGGIDKLQNGAIPFFFRDDTKQITGYTYKSPESGAIFFFDQDANGWSQQVKFSGSRYALANSKGNTTQTDLTMKDDGVGIEAATGNLFVTDGDGIDLTNLTKITNCTDVFASDLNDGGSTWYDIGSTIGQSNYRLKIDDGILVDNTAYTISLEFYNNNTFDVQIQMDFCDVASLTPTFSPGEKRRIYITSTRATYDTTYRFMDVGVVTVGAHVLVREPQIEHLDYPTSFVNGTRGNSGYLTIQSHVDLNIGSVVYKFNPTSSYEPAYINMLGTYGGAYDRFIMIRKSGTKYLPDFMYIRSGTVWVSIDISAYVVADQTNTAIWTWDVSGNHTMWINGINVRDSGHTLSDRSVDEFLFERNQTIEGFSMYDRVLSTSEIKLITENGFNIQPNGNLNTNKLITEPFYPSDVYHFPLKIDGADVYGKITPYEETNLIVDGTEDGIFVGTETINVMPDGDFTGGLQSTYQEAVPSATISILDEGPTNTSKSLRFENTGSTESFTSPYTGSVDAKLGVATSGETWTGSVKVRNPYDVDVQCAIFLTELDVNGNHLTNSQTQQTISSGSSEWTTIYITRTLTNASTGAVGSRLDVDTEYQTLEFSEWQIEKKSKRSPFVNGTRSVSSLEYNFNNDIGLDWNGEWTICYWKKPKLDRYNALIDFVIDSLGCNGNSVGGGYHWFGKNVGVEQTVMTDVATTNPDFTSSEFFDHWHFVVVRKVGTILTYSVYLIDGLSRSVSIDIGTVASNYFVTQYGYDLKLSGWDDSNTHDTYFKDLFVAKRALTDDEINSIRNKGLSKTADGIQVQGRIKTNEVL